MIVSHDEHPIIAQCTPKGSGAVALLRLTGLGAIEIATKLSKLAGNKQLIAIPTHTIHYGWVIDCNGITIDQVLFLIMHSPHTFTGQDTVEITCHNNPFIIEAIITQAIIHGARLATEGEFTKRAVLNNKIDIVQAEAINELIHANTQLSLKKSLAQLEGSFSHWIATLEKQLTHALALSEAMNKSYMELVSLMESVKNDTTQLLNQVTPDLIMLFNKLWNAHQGIKTGRLTEKEKTELNKLPQHMKECVGPIAIQLEEKEILAKPTKPKKSQKSEKCTVQ